jgi:hypothetical protein
VFFCRSYGKSGKRILIYGDKKYEAYNGGSSWIGTGNSDGDVCRL